MTSARVEGISFRLPLKLLFKIGTTREPERDQIDVLILRIWTNTFCASWLASLSATDFADGVVDLLKADIVPSPVRFEDAQVIVLGGPSLRDELDGDSIARHPIV
jgi:hypothetical protein